MSRQELIQKNLYRRMHITRAVRGFFYERGYLEVDTPLRNPALAVEAHVEPFECEGWYLQASPEICMKRMLAAGYTRIFQICKCFRKNERGARHLPEMNLLEWYAAATPYKNLGDECRELFAHIARALDMSCTLRYGQYNIDLAGPWEWLSLHDAFARYASMPLDEAVERGCFEEVLSGEVEPRLGFERPVFIYAYPKSMGSLARPAPNNPNVVERFELYVTGIEIANAFGELTDVAEQRRRFAAERLVQQKYGRQAMPMPRRFLEDLGHMPAACGIALGLDRLVMLFCNAKTIDEVTAFTPEEL